MKDHKKQPVVGLMTWVQEAVIGCAPMGVINPHSVIH